MAKKTTKKVTTKKAAKKKIPTKKVASKATSKKRTVKKAVKKVAIKKQAVKKVTKKSTAKKQPVKKVAKKSTAKKQPVKKVAKKSTTKKQPIKKTLRKKTAAQNLNTADIKKASVGRSETVNNETKDAPTSFSLDEVEAVIAKRKSEEPKASKAKVKKVATKTSKVGLKKKTIGVKTTPEKKRVHAAASLADILGFNPSQKKKSISEEASSVPRKWKKYYKLLVELRQHLQDELDLHTSDTLMHSAREDAGDLSSYGSHQADAGTDTFDRDFALSLVSSEQDALYEIEEAIRRILDGTYGLCEQTGEAIKKERLEAVPFARFSLEGQKEYEKNKNSRKNDRGIGEIFSDQSDAPKIMTDEDN